MQQVRNQISPQPSTLFWKQRLRIWTVVVTEDAVTLLPERRLSVQWEEARDRLIYTIGNFVFQF